LPNLRANGGKTDIEALLVRARSVILSSSRTRFLSDTYRPGVLDYHHCVKRHRAPVGGGDDDIQLRQRELISLIGAAIVWSRAEVARSADWTLTMGVVMTPICKDRSNENSS
jgi:hypothetical protein